MMLRKATLVIAAATFCTLSIYDFKANGDSLGKTFPGAPLPLTAPSSDQTLRQIHVGGKLLSIPRNYLWMADKMPAGDWTSPAIKVLLPDLAPLTTANRHCFTNYRDPCFRDVVTFGLLNEPPPTSAARQLQNLQVGPGLINPEPKLGPCGTVLYEAKPAAKPGYIVFEYFLQKVDDDPEPTLLRCAKNTIPHPLCNGYARAHGVSYYYNFERDYLCQWNSIRTRLDTLLAIFQKTS